MFEGPRLKIKRANQHITTLDESIKEFIKTDFCRFSTNYDPDSKLNSLDFQMLRDPPCDLPLIIGDAIHNARSALDIAQYELVTLVGCTPTEWTRFMFFENRDELIDKLGKGVLKGAPDIVTMIADEVRPYKTNDNPLVALHLLDIADKHRLTIPVFGIATLNHVDARATGPNLSMRLKDCTFRVDQGGVLQAIGVAGNLQIENQGQPVFSVLFGKGQALEGQPILSRLHQLSQLASGVIDIFENTVTAREGP